VAGGGGNDREFQIKQLLNNEHMLVLNLSLIIYNLILKVVSLGGPHSVKIVVLFLYVFEHKSGIGASNI